MFFIYNSSLENKRKSDKFYILITSIALGLSLLNAIIPTTIPKSYTPFTLDNKEILCWLSVEEIMGQFFNYIDTIVYIGI